MTRASESLILVLASRALARVIQIFALYVILHGHYSPGGGFQGGALLAASILLLRMTSGAAASQRHFKSAAGIPLGAIGALVFLGTGVVALLFGGNYLDYAHTPPAFLGLAPAEVRSLNILLIEIGIGLAVMATLVSIFDNLTQTDGDTDD